MENIRVKDNEYISWDYNKLPIENLKENLKRYKNINRFKRPFHKKSAREILNLVNSLSSQDNQKKQDLNKKIYENLKKIESEHTLESSFLENLYDTYL